MGGAERGAPAAQDALCVSAGTFAADLGQLFFPSDDPAASLMETFAVFGGAFLMRPLGGVIFGYIGDRVGRRRALVRPRAAARIRWPGSA